MKILPVMLGRSCQVKALCYLDAYRPCELFMLLSYERFRTPFLDASDQRLGSLAGDFWRVGIDGASVAIKAEGSPS